MKKTQIIIGIPSEENLARARTVAGALGLQWDNLSDSYLSRTYPQEDVYVAWIGFEFSENSAIYPMIVGRFDAIIDLRPFASNPKTLKLNDKYTAEITKETVTVGCQVFESEKILELAGIIEEMQ